MKSASKIATGFITGTLLGASLALLFAPKKGTKTRKLIGDQARKVSDSVGKAYSDTRRSLDSTAAKIMDKLPV